jgi:argininosuccinate lyase
MDIVSSIVSAIQLAIAAAPKAVALYEDSKAYISALFKAGVISKADQDALHAHVDAIQAAVEAGEVPPSWSVEPDPT